MHSIALHGPEQRSPALELQLLSVWTHKRERHMRTLAILCLSVRNLISSRGRIPGCAWYCPSSLVQSIESLRISLRFLLLCRNSLLPLHFPCNHSRMASQLLASRAQTAPLLAAQKRPACQSRRTVVTHAALDGRKGSMSWLAAGACIFAAAYCCQSVFCGGYSDRGGVPRHVGS